MRDVSALRLHCRRARGGGLALRVVWVALAGCLDDAETSP